MLYARWESHMVVGGSGEAHWWWYPLVVVVIVVGDSHRSLSSSFVIIVVPPLLPRHPHSHPPLRPHPHRDTCRYPLLFYICWRRGIRAHGPPGYDPTRKPTHTLGIAHSTLRGIIMQSHIRFMFITRIVTAWAIGGVDAIMFPDCVGWYVTSRDVQYVVMQGDVCAVPNG